MYCSLHWYPDSGILSTLLANENSFKEEVELIASEYPM